MAHQILEGTWEEVSRRADELSGKRVRVTVLADPATLPHRTPEELTAVERIEALDRLAEQNRNLPILPPEAFERESLYEDR